MSSYQTIPEELRDRDQWLLWDSAADTPRRPHWGGDFSVSWTDPDDWHSFEAAVELAQTRESWGIGYVFSKDNPDHARGVYGALDLDGVAEEDHGKPVDWLPSMQPFLDTGCYIEWSPSGTGLHIPIAGFSPPDWWRDCQVDEHEGVEAYGKKFFTFTGDHMRGSGGEVVDDGEWVDEWLMDVWEAVRGERAPPRRDADTDDLPDLEPGSTESTGNAEAIADAVDRLDAQRVAERTIVERWNDSASTSAGTRAFVPTWAGGNCNGTANIVNDELWNDTGGGGIGGPLVMAAIDLGELDPRHAEPSDVSGDLWWDAVEHLRDMGFNVPEYENAFSDDGKPTPVPPSSVDADDAEAVADDARVTDGGETTVDAGDADSGTDSPAEPDLETTWRDIRSDLRGADGADERAVPRFEAAMKLTRDYHFATLAENDQLYVYDPETGIYNDDGESTVRSELTQGLEEQYRGHAMSEVKDHIRGRTIVGNDDMGGPDGLIAAENCVIDLHEQTRHDHSPEYRFLSRLGCEFNPEASAPRFQAFLEEVVPSDTERKKLQEYAGYTLMHWGLPYHKALFLVGPTASGKSTFLDAINSMLGEGTVCSLTPQQLTGERFSGAELYGKWANIRNDIPAATVKNTGAFKEVVGGDPMKAERKRKDPFMFEPTAKHLYAANELPATETDDEAFYRRILLVPFPETIPEPERDKHLDDKLEDELPGILNWAIEGLQRLLGSGKFTGDRSPGRTQDTWEKWSDSVSRFKDAAISEGGGEAIPKSKLYAAYLEFCRQEGIPSDTQHSLTRGLKQEGLADGREYVDGDRERVFKNISLTGRGQQLVDDAQSDAADSEAGERRRTGLSGWD